jgi:ABC-type branched-subunit amino acid transport system ATPase component
MSAVLAVNGLERRFGGLLAVDHVSFEVNDGEIFGVIGPNGAGKTTLFDLISGVQQPSGGQIALYGKRIDRLSQPKRCELGLCRTFQTVQAFPDLTTRGNLEIASTGAVRGFRSWFARPTSGRIAHKVDDYLDAWDLRAVADARSASIPVFAQQRLAIAMTLAAGARVLLMDEPSGGLVEKEVAELLTMIRRVRDSGVTILLVDHKMSLMTRLCDRIMVMSAGSEIFTGTPAEVVADTHVREVYLGSHSARAAHRD